MTKYIISLTLLVGFFSTAFGQETNIYTEVEVKLITETFKVYRNCGMCKRTIEGSLTKESSITDAIWDIDSGEMMVTFDALNISLDAIKQKIADVGYDTDSHRAKLDVYRELPGCCQYKRPE